MSKNFQEAASLSNVFSLFIHNTSASKLNLSLMLVSFSILLTLHASLLRRCRRTLYNFFFQVQFFTVAQKCHGNFNLLTAIAILLTAILICSRQFQFYSRQFQFALCNFNLLTAISIYPRQFQFAHGSFNYSNFNFTQGNFNFFTAT